MSTKAMYTDQELCEATQVAYFNIDKTVISDYLISYGDYPTLQEIVAENGPSLYSGYDDMGDVTGDKAIMKQSIEDLCSRIAAGDACAGWKIVSVSDSNSKDGFYGVTIETGSSKAIVVFRGSESVDARQIVEDWIQADLGLINNVPTEQQLRVA